jgi:hypothetical protein
MNSVVSPQWQLIRHEKYGNQIYDWKIDPGESKNLINTPAGRSADSALASDLSH